eukprot:NODE_415_length_2277_cov_25.292639_g381_i0.p1 GENE.NODE_415_length_2277_cov_25.292639_g381_i0~~NODE_415_length_2277_cov_25.292639_g381_i0.p1  ORF type:complete len:712 (+),score=109.01 NODE_415_length_2277_cov_25.292639_g381_i0:27-2138(+)
MPRWVKLALLFFVVALNFWLFLQFAVPSEGSSSTAQQRDGRKDAESLHGAQLNGSRFVLHASPHGSEPTSPAHAVRQGVGSATKPDNTAHDSGFDRKERFLTGCIINGRHGNQLIAAARMWALARRYNRTLILPYFMQAPSMVKEMAVIRGSDLRVIHFETVYDVASLREGPVRVVTWRSFFGRVKKPKFACVRLQGCGGFNGPKVDMEFNCITEQFLDVSAPYLAVGNAVYSNWLAELDTTPCFWNYLRPARLIAEEVQRFLPKLPPRFTGVHLRTFKEDCEERLERKWWREYYPLKKVPNWNTSELYPVPTCRMNASYINKFRTDPDAPFFLGTDNYYPEVTKRLVSAGAKLYHSNVFTPPISILGNMLVDFWVMVEAEVFVGNPMSSMTWNACNIRWLRGKTCPNLPQVPRFPCFPYPSLVMPEEAFQHRPHLSAEGLPIWNVQVWFYTRDPTTKEILLALFYRLSPTNRMAPSLWLALLGNYEFTKDSSIADTARRVMRTSGNGVLETYANHLDEDSYVDHRIVMDYRGYLEPSAERVYMVYVPYSEREALAANFQRATADLRPSINTTFRSRPEVTFVFTQLRWVDQAYFIRAFSEQPLPHIIRGWIGAALKKCYLRHILPGGLDPRFERFAFPLPSPLPPHLLANWRTLLSEWNASLMSTTDFFSRSMKFWQDARWKTFFKDLSAFYFSSVHAETKS